MKNIKSLLFVISLFAVISVNAQEELAPFFGVQLDANMAEIKNEIPSLITSNGFTLLGSYQVADNDHLWVIAFTSDELIDVCANYKDRGALASVLKIGLYQNEDKLEVSLLNPNYMFYAYFGEDYKEHSNKLEAINNKAKNMLSTHFGELKAFGGGLTAEELGEYHYKIMMPYFDDPVELETYGDFKEGVTYIRKKISESGSDIKLVYELMDERHQTAVFGIGLLDPEEGEPHFLPIIGERHIAAMPYEIILQGDEVTMLAGKYRFALYWPELTMGEFMKIMSTPGDVEDFMKTITEKE